MKGHSTFASDGISRETEAAEGSTHAWLSGIALKPQNARLQLIQPQRLYEITSFSTPECFSGSALCTELAGPGRDDVSKAVASGVGRSSRTFDTERFREPEA